MLALLARVSFLGDFEGHLRWRQIKSVLTRPKTPDGKTERGQGLMEYALILVLVAIVVVIGLTLYGNSVEDLYDFAVTGLVDIFTGGGSP